MRRVGLAILVLCLSTGLARADTFNEVCSYFGIRAESGAGNIVFRRHLARECNAALAAHGDAPPGSEARRMAGAVLGAMQDLQAVLEEIPLARLARQYPPHMLRSAPRLLRRPVSASGEVLIARVIGVTPRLSEWESWRMSRR